MRLSPMNFKAMVFSYMSKEMLAMNGLLDINARFAVIRTPQLNSSGSQRAQFNAAATTVGY